MEVYVLIHWKFHIFSIFAGTGKFCSATYPMVLQIASQSLFILLFSEFQRTVHFFTLLENTRSTKVWDLGCFSKHTGTRKSNTAAVNYLSDYRDHLLAQKITYLSIRKIGTYANWGLLFTKERGGRVKSAIPRYWIVIHQNVESQKNY